MSLGKPAALPPYHNDDRGFSVSDGEANRILSSYFE
jgi:hypothetical protein